MGKISSNATGYTGIKLIYDQLERSVRSKKLRTELIPSRYALLTADELYEQFLKVIPDHKGMLASSFGSRGWGISLDFYMDLVNFALPGIFAVPIGVSANGALLSSSMLVIQRMFPKSLAPTVTQVATPETGNPDEAQPEGQNQPETPVQPVWSTGNPVCFNSFFGYTKEYGVSASAQALFALGPSDVWSGNKELEDKEESPKNLAFMEMPLALGGTASLERSRSHSALYAIDVSPGWYANENDKILKADFLNVLGEKSKRALKVEIAKWVRRFSSVFYGFLTFDVSIEDEGGLPSLQKAYLEHQQRLLDIAAQKALQGSSSKIKGTAFLGFIQSLWDQAELIAKKIEGNTPTKDLVSTLNTLVGLLPDDATIKQYYAEITGNAANAKTQAKYKDYEAKVTKAVSEIKTSAQSYIDRLTKLKETPPDKSQIPKKLYRRNLTPEQTYLSFVKIASDSSGQSAGVNAILGFGGASGKATGEYKNSGIRFQSFALSPQNNTLVFTQDTYITYRSVAFTAEAYVIGVAGTQEIYQKMPKSLNGMTYQSASIYWKYPEGGTGETTQVRPEKGSGCSFGASVFVKEMAACSKDIATIIQPDSTSETNYTGKYSSFVNRLAGHLHVHPQVLARFLAAPFFQNLTEEKIGGRKALLIESSLRLPNDVTVTAVKKSKKGKNGTVDVWRLGLMIGKELNVKGLEVKKGPFNPHINSFIIGSDQEKKDACTQYLDALRVRVRIADSTESAVEFKLGPHGLLSGSGGSPGINLQSIERADEDGIVDIYTVRFGEAFVGGAGTSTSGAMAGTARKSPLKKKKTRSI
ncbi:MAG: hypothetical protein R3B47_07345 [Bacteroidia bacterium]